MSKSTQAFRTIREVADWLDVAAHVLRFWESKFPQIKPVKRAGGRRYYRPADMELVGGIKVLLHDQGMTIRGVQKLIHADGIEAVAALSPPIDALLVDADTVESEAEVWAKDAAAETPAAPAEPQQPDLPLQAAEPQTDPEPEAPAPVSIVPKPDLATTEPPATGAPLAPGLAGLAALAQAAGPLTDDTRAKAATGLQALAALKDRMSADPQG